MGTVLRPTSSEFPMLPEALPTPRDRLPDHFDPRPASLFDDVAGQTGPPDAPVGLAVDAFAVEWQIVTSGDPGR